MLLRKLRKLNADVEKKDGCECSCKTVRLVTLNAVLVREPTPPSVRLNRLTLECSCKKKAYRYVLLVSPFPMYHEHNRHVGYVRGTWEMETPEVLCWLPFPPRPSVLPLEEQAGAEERVTVGTSVVAGTSGLRASGTKTIFIFESMCRAGKNLLYTERINLLSA